MLVSVYIFTKYIKTTAFQTSPFEKKRNKQLKFQISSFKQQISDRNYCSQFQALPGHFANKKSKIM